MTTTATNAAHLRRRAIQECIHRFREHWTGPVLAYLSSDDECAPYHHQLLLLRERESGRPLLAVDLASLSASSIARQLTQHRTYCLDADLESLRQGHARSVPDTVTAEGAERVVREILRSMDRRPVDVARYDEDALA
jgi:hypothetical protein